MAMLLEFLERAFEIKGAGWIMLLLMTSVTAFMVFAWVEHWPFRLITAPSLFFGAVLANALKIGRASCRERV